MFGKHVYILYVNNVLSICIYRVYKNTWAKLLGITFLDKKCTEFFMNIVRTTMQNRRLASLSKAGSTATRINFRKTGTKRNDIIDLFMDELEKDHSSSVFSEEELELGNLESEVSRTVKCTPCSPQQEIKRAPRWMQKSMLEWAHRLYSEPKRLWRRYLILAPRFVMLAGLETLLSARLWRRRRTTTP